MDTSMITTSNQFEGYAIIKHLGVVRGITVRSRSLLGNMAGEAFKPCSAVRFLFIEQLCEKTREEAFQLMITTCPRAWGQCHCEHEI